MQFFLFLLLLSMLLAVAVVSEEIDVDSDGTLLDKWSTPRRKVAQSAGRNVIVVNSFPDRSIGLYWEDPNSEDEFKMFDIAANGSANLNTFNGHTFYAKEDGKSARLPDSINIRENSAYYSIGPAETKSYRFSVADGISTQFGHHGSRGEVEQAAVKSALSHIKVIGARTTALSAKFRCHLASVDYYYDNGAEGTFQGSLTMGKETTINTYEGHVFFFTKKGDKSVEFARYQMRKEQVTSFVCTKMMISMLS